MDTISSVDLSAGHGPKYQRLAEAIRTAIDEGTLSSGARLPTVREMAYQLGITPGTVARAYRLLTDAGDVQAEVGRGTFVSEPHAEHAPAASQGSDLQRNEGPVELFSPSIAEVGQADLLRRLLGDLGNAPDSALLNYPSRGAYAPLRAAAVEWLKDAQLGALDPDDVVLTHGGQNAISLVLQAIISGAEPVVLVEEMGYPGFSRAAQGLRAKVVAVPMDAQGVQPDALDRIARAHDAQVFCTVPEVHNPTLLYTPPERRRELARVAEARGLEILEDECYNIDGPRSETYRAMCPERGWYISSFSKSLTPALRVGYAVAPRGRGGGLRRAAEQGFFGLAWPIAEMARQLFLHPETRVLTDRVRRRMAEYVQVAVNVLGRFDLSWHPDVSFVWLRLPDGWRAEAFCRAAEADGVRVRSAEDFVLRDGNPPHAVRIAINAHVTLEHFEDAMLKLRTLLDDPPRQLSV